MKDPIVEEVRQTREKIWEECGRNWNNYLKFLHELRQKYGWKVLPENVKTAAK